MAANFAVYSHGLEHSTFIHGLLKENRQKTTTDCTLIAPQKNNTKAKGKEQCILLRGKKDTVIVLMAVRCSSEGLNEGYP